MSDESPRVRPLEPDEWGADAAKILEPLRQMGGGRVINIFATLAHHPDLLRRWLVFGNHVLGKSTLSARERELAILRVGFLCRAEYEWGQHVLIARGIGISDDEIAWIAEGPEAAGWSPLEAALLRATDELHREQRVGDATWQELSAHYDVKQLLDLIFTVGQYTLVSMALNTLGVERDPGVPGLPAKTRSS
jgi:alkylhydroperoxidase family enzyme